jgi:hypothetical protein
MSDKKQTAVEWLEKAFYTYAESTGINNNKWLIDEEDLDKLIEQAKAMEKEQTIEAFTSAYLIGEDNITQEDARKEAEQYYLETYE